MPAAGTHGPVLFFDGASSHVNVGNPALLQIAEAWKCRGLPALLPQWSDPAGGGYMAVPGFAFRQ